VTRLTDATAVTIYGWSTKRHLIWWVVVAALVRVQFGGAPPLCLRRERIGGMPRIQRLTNLPLTGQVGFARRRIQT
jgi:hypothetical protein